MLICRKCQKRTYRLWDFGQMLCDGCYLRWTGDRWEIWNGSEWVAW